MSEMDQTRRDVSDTQPLPVRSPAPERTLRDIPQQAERPRAEPIPDPTRQDLPSRRARRETGRSQADRTRQETWGDLASGTVPSWTEPSRTGTPVADRSRSEPPGEGARPDQVTLRFGPGVPAEVAQVWRDGARSRPRRPLSRRIAGGVLTLAIALLAALAVWWLLRGGGPGVRITAVSVRAPRAVQHCDTTVRVVGTIRTNGGHGDVSYRWRRSDGQVSGVFTETLHKGQRSVQVPLRWTIEGTGTLHAVATLEIVTPRSPAGQASAGFAYACG